MSAPTQRQSLWVRVHDWVLVEAELPEPTPGSVLDGTGVRVRGNLERADPRAEEGMVRCDQPAGEGAQPVEYLVTGSAMEARDFDFDSGSGSRHGGTDVVLTVNGSLIQAQVDGWARDITHGSRLCVRGELLVIPYYEWDDFGLVDTRGAWTVEETLRLADGDALLRLLPLLTSP